MLHRDVLKNFNELFPMFAEEIVEWWPTGYNTIRIRFKDKLELVFYYIDKTDWRIQTVENFIKDLKGVKKHES